MLHDQAIRDSEANEHRKMKPLNGTLLLNDIFKRITRVDKISVDVLRKIWLEKPDIQTKLKDHNYAQRVAHQMSSSVNAISQYYRGDHRQALKKRKTHDGCDLIGKEWKRLIQYPIPGQDPSKNIIAEIPQQDVITHVRLHQISSTGKTSWDITFESLRKLGGIFTHPDITLEQIKNKFNNKKQTQRN